MLTSSKAAYRDAACRSCPFKEPAVKFQRRWPSVTSVWTCNSSRGIFHQTPRDKWEPEPQQTLTPDERPARETSLAGIKGESFQTECLSRPPGARVHLCCPHPLLQPRVPLPGLVGARGGPAPCQKQNQAQVPRGHCVPRTCWLLCISCLIVGPPFLARWELFSPFCRM